MKTYRTLFSILFLLCFDIIFCVAQVEQPRMERGVIDLRQWDFEKQGEVKLNGSWHFSWKQLLSPSEINKANSKDYFEFPSVWNGKSSVYEKLSGQGFATYSADVLFDSTVSVLSISLPDFYCNYILWVNGKRLASNGKVGTSRKDSEGQWLPLTVIFPVRESTLHFVLQVSNFQHNKGGCNDDIYLGLPEQQYQKRELAVISNIILFGGLGLIGFFFVILFFFFRHEKAALYFAAICITWAIRSVFTNLYLFINWMPNFDFELGAKIEYLALYLTATWGVLFVSNLFPEDTNQKVKNVMLILNSLFILVTLATPAFTYSMLLSAYLVLVWIILCYVAFVVVMAIIYGRKGAWFSVISILLGIIMFSYDLLTFTEFLNFNPLVFNIGYITIFLLNATAFAYQLSQTITPKQKIDLDWSIK